ncbi:MAG TPA: hypothetical protein VFC39_07000 [Acidobacteriaceae bacterium]|nr:hypothetical protein [Acidobacteriaceae bacterium]
MNVSPDVQAYYCYLIVLLLAMYTALRQISERLKESPGKWIMVNTWFLFFAYTLLPLGLFWLLDRTNAAHDTSLFAAVLVGMGYQQVLSGTLTTVRAPADVSKLMQPFATWADSIAKRITDRIAVNTFELDTRLITKILNDKDSFDALNAVAMAHVADPRALKAQLDLIDADHPILGDAGVLSRKASALHLAVKQASPRNFQFLLRKGGVMRRWWYFWYAKEWRSKFTATVVALLLVFSIAIIGRSLWKPEYRATYLIWRLHRDNATDYDRYRARISLSDVLAKTPTAYPQLITPLRIPSLPVKTADNILSLIVETKSMAFRPGSDNRTQLIESLRTENSDVRGRIQKVLLYLASEQNLTVPEDLRNWTVDPKNTATDIDAKVKEWNDVGNTSSVPPTLKPKPAS